jgi:hypothetical protein
VITAYLIGLKIEGLQQRPLPELRRKMLPD